MCTDKTLTDTSWKGCWVILHAGVERGRCDGDVRAREMWPGVTDANDLR